MHHEIFGSSIGRNFRAHHIDMRVLARDVEYVEHVRIGTAPKDGGIFLSVDEQIAGTAAKVRRQILIAKLHNKFEDKLPALTREIGKGRARVADLVTESRSPGVHKLLFAGFIRRAAERNLNTNILKQLLVFSLLSQTNRQIIGSQRMYPNHVPGNGVVRPGSGVR